jgi:DNA polymerase-1
VDRESVLIVDVENLAHRAFYATTHGPDKTPNQFHNEVAVNMLATWPSMIAKLVREIQIDHVIFCLDNTSRFRKEIYPEYKANRKPKPPHLAAQLPILRQIARGSSLPFIEDPLEEADDLVSSAARMLMANFTCYIASSDKDFNQVLHSNRVRQAKPLPFGQGWKMWTVLDTLQEFGIQSDQFARYSAMVKDTTDNIPGVAGIGPVTAVKLLQGRPDDEELIRRIAVKKKIEVAEAGVLFRLNYQLTKTRDIPVVSQRQELVADKILREHGCQKAADTMLNLSHTYGSKPCPI